MKKNSIPRQFYCIKAKMLIDTNMDKVGDILHIFKNLSGYLALNKRTGIYAYVFPSMLRNPECVEILEISK